jgi:isopropylmalate/homocitrate/citramalate synthase
MSEEELLKTQPWYKPGKWYASPMTWLPEVRTTMPDLPERVHVVDPTLREAEDNVAVSFAVGQKMEIARRLSDIGVEAIDCGYVGNPEGTRRLWRRSRRAGAWSLHARFLQTSLSHKKRAEAVILTPRPALDFALLS